MIETIDKMQAPPADGATVLVVEDEVLLRLVIAEYLRDCGYRVIEAAHADEAIVVLSEPNLSVDILFSDIEMPGSMNGFSLAQWTRSNRHDVKVILAGSVPRAVNAAVNLCEEGPLPKPYEPQSVHDRIRRLLAGRPDPKPRGTSDSIASGCALGPRRRSDTQTRRFRLGDGQHQQGGNHAERASGKEGGQVARKLGA
jgi:DNA-binding response OmpR family regulator